MAADPAVSESWQELEPSLVVEGVFSSIERSADPTQQPGPTIKAYDRIIAQSRDLSRFARTYAKDLKQKYPMQCLGAIAGASIVLGVLLRIRRYNGYES
jgi:hypothetical protein